MVRLEDRNVARYEGHLFKVALTTGEVVECINDGNRLYELERISDHIPTADGHFLRQCYVSSWPLPNVVLEKDNSGNIIVRDMGKAIIENAATYSQDETGAAITLGAHPYYLCIIQ